MREGGRGGGRRLILESALRLRMIKDVARACWTADFLFGENAWMLNNFSTNGIENTTTAWSTIAFKAQARLICLT